MHHWNTPDTIQNFDKKGRHKYDATDTRHN